MGIPYESVGDPGIAVTIQGRGDGRTIAPGADMDVLDVNEANDVSCKSKNEGIGRVCGHDDHMAMLLGAGIESNGACYPHHEKFNIDEDALSTGAELHAQYTLDSSAWGIDAASLFTTGKTGLLEWWQRYPLVYLTDRLKEEKQHVGS